MRSLATSGSCAISVRPGIHVLAATILLAACVPREPVTPEPPAVLKASMLPPATPIEVTRPGVVRVQWTGNNGVPVTGVSATWTQRNPQVASLQSPGPDSVVVVGIAPGMDTIRVTGRLNGVSTEGLAVVEIRRRSAANLRVQPQSGFVPVGATLRITAVARDSSGSSVAVPPQFSTSASAVATVDGTGLISAVGVGTALVTASLDQLSDTVRITVSPSGTLRASLTTSRLSPGGQIGLTLASSTGLSARVHGIEARVIATSPTSAELTVPMLPFEPCLPPNTRLPLVLRVGTDSLVMPLEAEERPVTADITVGRSLLLRDALVRGCRVEARQAGTYLVMPFRTDTPEGWGPSYFSGAGDTVEVTITNGSVPPRATTGLVSRHGDQQAVSKQNTASFILPSSARRLGDVVVLGADRSPASIRLATARSCSAITKAGDTLWVRTSRDAQGRVSGFGGERVEPWIMLSFGRRIMAAVDTSALRISIPSMRDSVSQLVAAYDTSVAPAFDRVYDTPLPDRDGNGGRIVMLLGLNNGVPSSGFAFPRSSLRADCDPVGGEYLWLNVNTWTGDRAPVTNFPVAAALQTLSHEAMHVYDMSRWPDNKTPHSWWIAEGMAEFGTHLWVFNGFADPLTAGLTRLDNPPFMGYFKVATCLTGAYRQALPKLYKLYGDGYFAGYQLACAYIVHLMQRATLEQGRSLQKAVSDWSRMPLTPTIRSMGGVSNVFLSQTRSNTEIIAEWLISWYAAGGYVPGLSPALSNPLLDPRAAYSRAGLRFPIPDTRVGPFANPIARSSLGEPDVQFVEWIPDAGGRIQVLQTGGRATENLHVMILRAR
jgi:hypothetical protein